MTVIQAQLIAGLIITCVMLIPSLVAFINQLREKRVARKLALEQLQMEHDLYGIDILCTSETLDLDSLEDTCEFDHNYQG